MGRPSWGAGATAASADGADQPLFLPPGASAFTAVDIGSQPHHPSSPHSAPNVTRSPKDDTQFANTINGDNAATAASSAPRSTRRRGSAAPYDLPYAAVNGNAPTSAATAFHAQHRSRLHSCLQNPIVLLCLLSAIMAITVLLSMAGNTSPTDPSTRFPEASRQSWSKSPLNPVNFLGGATAAPRITLEDVAAGTFKPQHPAVALFQHAGRDGFRIITGENGFELVHVEDKTRVPFLPFQVLDASGNEIRYADFLLSPNAESCLLMTNVVSGWRYSRYADYWLFDIKSRTVRPLTKSKPDKVIPGEIGSGMVGLVKYSPDGSRIAWVRDNDVFIFDIAEDREIRITSDGSKDIINGVADWVYEEEVLKSHSALWFSPDSKRLAYLRFDESKVHDFVMPEYALRPDSPYPENVVIRYPKPGTNNPIVTLHIANPDGVDSSAESSTKEQTTKTQQQQEEPKQPQKKKIVPDVSKPDLESSKADIVPTSDEDVKSNTDVDSVSDKSDTTVPEEAPVPDSKGQQQRRRDPLNDEPSTTKSKSKLTVPVEIPKKWLFDDDDRLFVEVSWTKAHSELLVRMTNRVQDKQRLLLVSNTDSSSSTTTTSTSEDEWEVTLIREEKCPDAGWITKLQPITLIPSKESSAAVSAAHSASKPIPPLVYDSYVELRENNDGFMQIALYKSSSVDEFVWLTTGAFEIDSIVGVDAATRTIFYTSTEGDSTQRHLYSITLDDKTRKKLSPPKNIVGLKLEPLIREQNVDLGDSSVPAPESGEYVGKVGFYSAKFSPLGKYYILEYEGPDVPMSIIYSTESSFTSVESNNNELRAKLADYDLPTYKFLKIPVSDAKLGQNVQIIFPPKFDSSGSTKYPVLFNVYGGPNSQTVKQTFDLDFHYALASSAGFIVVKVDGRGTGFSGRKFRTAVAGHLGTYEVQDQLAAARFIAALPFVDSLRMGIWGWSFGGFLASKVIEANSGLFSLGMAVAPVTDWRYYDSVYTERYMKTPQKNAEGYTNSAVNNMDGFSNADFLVAHGTGDDNVHFQNTAALIWKLTGAHIKRYRMQMYTDSNHSIMANGAHEELFKLLYEFITSKFKVFSKEAPSR